MILVYGSIIHVEMMYNILYNMLNACVLCNIRKTRRNPEYVQK